MFFLSHFCVFVVTSAPLRSAGRPLYSSSARHVSGRWTVTPVYFTLNSEDALHTVLEVKGSGFDVASLSDNFVLRKYTVFHGVGLRARALEEQACERSLRFQESLEGMDFSCVNFLFVGNSNMPTVLGSAALEAAVRGQCAVV